MWQLAPYRWESKVRNQILLLIYFTDFIDVTLPVATIKVSVKSLTVLILFSIALPFINGYLTSKQSNNNQTEHKITVNGHLNIELGDGPCLHLELFKLVPFNDKCAAINPSQQHGPYGNGRQEPRKPSGSVGPGGQIGKS